MAEKRADVSRKSIQSDNFSKESADNLACSWKSRERDLTSSSTWLTLAIMEAWRTSTLWFTVLFVFSFKEDVSSDLNLLSSSCRVLCVTNSDDWPLVATAEPVPPLGGAIMRRGKGEGGVF